MRNIRRNRTSFKNVDQSCQASGVGDRPFFHYAPSTTFMSTSSTLHMYHMKTLRYGANFSEYLSMSCSDMYFHYKMLSQHFQIEKALVRHLWELHES